MKALLVSTYDTVGGAARATYRLHQGLRDAGCDSQMVVQSKRSEDPTVFSLPHKLPTSLLRLKNPIDTFPVRLYRKREKTIFSPQWLTNNLAREVNQLKPDVVNLHWVSHAYLQIEALAQLKCPIVWTLHDMWAFTGGCHYSGNCTRYEESCGQCPILGSSQDHDLSRWVWERKLKTWQNLNLTIVSPSHWLGCCASSSTLLRQSPIEVIPNGIDVSQYQPCDPKQARIELGLPEHKYLVLFGAMNAVANSRKGFQFLKPALSKLSQSKWKEKIELVVFGSEEPVDGQKEEIGFKVHYLGHLKDSKIVQAYSAAHIFVAPSTQENLSNTVVEAMACGLPCLAFNIGGMPDMIDHHRNGYLAKPYEVDDLMQGITWVLEDPERYQTLRFFARKKTESQFSVELQTKRYLDLYASLVTNANR